MKNSRLTLLAALAVALTVGALMLDRYAALPEEVIWDDVRAEAKAGGYRLISTDEVWKRYNENRDRPLLVDTRQQWEYRTGHIRGAVNFPMEPTWLSRGRKKGRLKAVLGPDKSRLIVFY